MKKSPLDEFLKDLLADMTYAVEQEDCSIQVTKKDIEKLQKVINRNKRRESLLERQRDIRNLFERKFINYRNKLVSIYRKMEDEPIRKEIRHFLEEEQGDVFFNKPSEDIHR